MCRCWYTPATAHGVCLLLSWSNYMSARILLVSLIVVVAAHLLAPFDEVQAPKAQPKEQVADIRDLKLRDWEPKPMMVTKTTVVEKPLYPVIDMHNHLGG